MSDFLIERDIESKFGFIKSVCRKFYTDRDEVELFFSELLELVWKNRDKFNGNDHDFHKWVNAIARNAYINHYRVNKKYIKVDVSFGEKAGVDHHRFECRDFIDDLSLHIIKSHKGSVSKKHLSVLRYYFIAGNTIEDTAKFMNIPEGSVKNICHKIRAIANKRYKVTDYV